MKLGKYIEKNNSIQEWEIGSQESEKSEVEMMTQESLEKELKSVILILRNSSDPEMIQYKNELEFEIEKRKLLEIGSQESVIKNYFSDLLQENFVVNYDKGIVRFETGEKYSFEEIMRMKRNNYQEKDVRLLHLLKSKFGVKYVETTEVM